MSEHCDDCAPEFTECWHDISKCRKREPRFVLRWYEEYDDEDNSVWEAASPCFDDGAAFMFRIRQRLRGNRHEFYEDSDAEVMMEPEPRAWKSLDEAKTAIQADADEIVRAEKC